MTSKKRKYGDLSARPLPTEDESLVDDVFAAFTRRPVAQAETGPSTVDSPPAADRPAIVDSPPSGQPVGRPTDSPSTVDSPANVDDPLSYLPPVKGHTELPHRFTDHLCRVLSPDEQSVFTQLYRLSWGWGKDTCLVSNPRLSERSSVPETTLRRVVKKLEAKRLVVIIDRLFGGREQGILYRVSRLDGLSTVDSPATVAPNKIKDIKNDIKEAPPNYCSKCKDTSGWLYPNGPTGGVVRCKHD